MTTGLTTKMSCGSVYVSPAVRTIELNSEGVLCISFGPATAGFMIEDATEEDWGTIY